MLGALSLAHQHGAAGLHVTRLTPAGRALDQFSDIAVPMEEFRRAINLTIRHYQIMFGFRHKFSVVDKCASPFVLDLAYGALTSVTRPQAHTTCGLGCSFVSLSAFGDVSPCSSLAAPDFFFGNVQDEPIQRIYSRMAAEMRKISVKEVPGCDGCEVQGLCAGGCRARAYWTTGDIKGKDPLCDREGILNMLFEVGPNEYLPTNIVRQLAEADVSDRVPAEADLQAR